MKDNLEKLIENTLKDILLANAALTFILQYQWLLSVGMGWVSQSGL